MTITHRDVIAKLRTYVYSKFWQRHRFSSEFAGWGFSPFKFSSFRNASCRQNTSRVFSSRSDDDSSFSMASVQKRMDQVSQNDSILPLVVLDSMLPRQVLKISVSNDLPMSLVKTRLEEEIPYFGMLGMA